MQAMERRINGSKHGLWLLCGLALFTATNRVAAEPPPATITAFQAYCAAVESRLVKQHGSDASFLAPWGKTGDSPERLQRGGPVIERVKKSVSTVGSSSFNGAMLHHWRGTAFARGATAADFERLMRDFDSYPQYFAPQVIRAGVTGQRDGHLQAWMRIRQKHVITVVMDTAYDESFGRLDARHGYSISRSTQVNEIAAAGTREERTLAAGEEHGFLWRLNTYWSYEEGDGGLYLQVEAVSLTRSVPAGLGWIVGPYVESIPRESMEFTLNSACKAIAK
jgi:hypothetical protein